MAKIVLLGLDQEADGDGIVSANETCEYLGLEYIDAYARGRGLDPDLAS